MIIVAAAVVPLVAVGVARLGQTLEQLDAANENEPGVVPSRSDEHILRALAQDADFRRAADELLQDPDPQTQQEARHLLGEVGAEDGTDLLSSGR